MTTLDEIRAIGAAARQLPSVVRRRGCETVRSVAARNERCPVLLVHGYAGTEGVWTPLRTALADAGFGHLVSLNYNSFASDPNAIAAELVDLAAQAMADTGASRVHLVGHSLGGLIVRKAAQHGRAGAATAITIATPHRGAPLARIAPGRCRTIMQPGPRSAPGDELIARRVRWLSYYSDGDRVVPTTSARLDEPRLRATNVLIPGCGHLTICRDARLIRSLVGELIRSDTSSAPSVAAAHVLVRPADTLARTVDAPTLVAA